VSTNIIARWWRRKSENKPKGEFDFKIVLDNHGRVVYSKSSASLKHGNLPGVLKETYIIENEAEELYQDGKTGGREWNIARYKQLSMYLFMRSQIEDAVRKLLSNTDFMADEEDDGEDPEEPPATFI